MTSDERDALFRSASTLQEAHDFLVERKMPELAAYLCRVLLPNLHPDRRETSLMELAAMMLAGKPGTLRAYHEKPPVQVAAALLWVLDVCRRGRPAALREWAARSRSAGGGDVPCDVCGRLSCDGHPLVRREGMRD